MQFFRTWVDATAFAGQGAGWWPLRDYLNVHLFDLPTVDFARRAVHRAVEEARGWRPGLRYEWTDDRRGRLWVSETQWFHLWIRPVARGRGGFGQGVTVIFRQEDD